MLLFKSWRETRLRFLIGLILVTATICHTLLRAPETLALIKQQMPWAHVSFLQYIWLTIYGGSLPPIWIVFAVILSNSGPRKERAAGACLFTLSLPVRRRVFLLSASALALTELAILATVPALLTPWLAQVRGEVFPYEQAFRYEVLLLGGGLVFHGWSLLAAQFTDSEHASLGIALCGIGFCFVLVKRVPALDRLDVFDTVSGIGLLDPHTFLLTGGTPWGTFAATLALYAVALCSAVLLIERSNF